MAGGEETRLALHALSPAAAHEPAAQREAMARTTRQLRRARVAEAGRSLAGGEAVTPTQHVAPLMAQIAAPPAPSPRSWSTLAACAAWHEEQAAKNHASAVVAHEKGNLGDAGIYGDRETMHNSFAVACREADTL